VLNDYTLASVLDRQFGDLPVGLRKILLLSMIHGFAGNPRGQLHLHYLEAPRYEEQPLPIGRLLGRNWFRCYRYLMLAYRGLTMEGGTSGTVVFLVTSNVIVIANFTRHGLAC
jgi:hypothetical protein